MNRQGIIDRQRGGYYYPNHLYFYREADEPENSLHFGVELETAFTHDTEWQIIDFVKDLPEQLFCVGDDSILDNERARLGIEVIGHPMTYRYLRNHPEIWQYVFDWRKKGLRAYSLDSCGMHVHLSRSKFTDEQIARLIHLFASNKDFCKKISQRCWAELNRWAAIPDEDPAEFRQLVENIGASRTIYSYSKTTAISIRTKTIEIRLFNGVLGSQSFYKNIEFCQVCYDYITNDPGVSFLEYIKHGTSSPNLTAFLNELNHRQLNHSPYLGELHG